MKTAEEQGLGVRVRTARQTLKWNQVKLAEHLSTTQATVSRIEAGGNYSRMVGRVFENFVAAVASGELVPEAEPAEASS